MKSISKPIKGVSKVYNTETGKYRGIFLGFEYGYRVVVKNDNQEDLNGGAPNSRRILSLHGGMVTIK